MRTRSGRIFVSQPKTPKSGKKAAKKPVKKAAKKTKKRHFSSFASSVAKQTKQSHKLAMKNPYTKYLYARQQKSPPTQKIHRVKLSAKNRDWGELFPEPAQYLVPPPLSSFRQSLPSNTSKNSTASTSNDMTGW